MAASYHGINDESIKTFFKDMQPYRDNFVLIGGWLPFLYSKYVWKNKPVGIVNTMDIDVALKEDYFFSSRQISETLDLSGHYEKERMYDQEEKPSTYFLKIDDKKIKIDFISNEYMDPAVMKKIAGDDIEVVPLEYINILYENTQTILFEKDFKLRITKPSAYIFVKGLTCHERSVKESDYKFKKDCWSIYFVLRNIEEKGKHELFEEIRSYKEKYPGEYKAFELNLNTYLKGEKAMGIEGIASFFPDLPKKEICRDICVRIDDMIEKINKTIDKNELSIEMS